MKKLFTLDDLFLALIGAVGYGLSFEIPKILAYPEWLCIVICLVVGTIIEGVSQKIVFSKFIQNNHRLMAFATLSVIFVIALYIAEKIIDISITNYVVEQIQFVILPPITFFAVNLAIRWYRVKKIRERYGDGSEGFMVDDVIAKSDLAELNKQNQEINGEFDKNLAVKTKTGIFVGRKNKNTIFFSGIPYAKPPVKNLRWKAPEPLPESDKVFEAKYLGASAIQVDYEGSFLKNHRQSEDCLTLNICVGAKKSKQKKPVVVVIHHGDFTYCGSADPLFPGGEKYPDATNLGLLDQIAALKWIKENISAFGGNPENITVMGFESGALSISQLIACEKARNLFQKAFIFYGNPLSTYNSPEPSRNLAKKLLQETSTTNMEELLQLSTEQLKEATQKLVLNLVSGPTRDDKLIPLDIYDAYRNVSGIEFIIGIPSNERQIYKSVVGDEKYKDFISKELEDILSYLDKNYNDIAKDFRNYIEEQSEKMPEFEAKAKAYEQFYTLNTYRAAKKLAESGNKVHLLYWNVKPLTLIENLGSGTVDVAATFFGSREAVQMYGNVLNKDIAEILQNLLRKFESDDEMKLFNNEIKGIDAIDWEKFPKALIVSEKSFKCELIAEKLIEVKSLLKLLEEETFHNGNQNFI